MKFYKLAIATMFAAALAALPMPASAQWSSAQREDFVSVCAAACRKNPRVPEAQRSQCDDYCDCVRTEGEKFMNETQYEQMMKDFTARKQTADVSRFIQLTPACNQKAFAPR